MSQNHFPPSEATDWFVHLWILWLKYGSKSFLEFFFILCFSLSLALLIVPSYPLMCSLLLLLVQALFLSNLWETVLREFVSAVLSPRTLHWASWVEETCWKCQVHRAGVGWGFRSAYWKPAVPGSPWFMLVFRAGYKPDLRILRKVSAFMKVEYEWATRIFIISFK